MTKTLIHTRMIIEGVDPDSYRDDRYLNLYGQMKTLFLLFTFHFLFFTLNAQEIAVLKYKGGGDWYANPTALKNLIAFCNSNIHTKMDPKSKEVEVGSPD